MFTGVRVVRGPDWKWGDQDGGYGCVGTVVPAQDTNATGVWVRWDSGKAANYRAGGASGKFDLRIFDNAQLGVKHPAVVCDCCQEDGILGMRWKCLECHDFDLCHSCYNEGKHDLGHRFTRIEANSVPGIEVSVRFGAQKCRSLGMFPGARVVRGPDWEWGNQDGGDGTVGTVSDVDGAEGTGRSWATVHWPNRTNNSYRLGHEGKVDLRYTERETCGEFYIDHLPRLDATKVRPYVSQGDKVRLLDIAPAKLKELQLERCGWNEEITNCRGKVGEVIMVDKDGDVKVNFDGSSYFIHPACIAMEKKQETVAATGSGEGADLSDLLAGLFLKSQLEKLGDLLGESGLSSGSPSGGMALFNAAASGSTDRVREIIGKNPQAVKFQNDKGQTALQAAAHRGHHDAAIALINGETPLELRDEDGDTALAYAVLGDKPDTLKSLLQAGSDINATNKKGLTSLHLAAAKGHRTCVEVLLKHEKQRCDVNHKDNEGNTPLFVAIIKGDRQIIQLLIEHPRVELRVTNKRGFNSLHHAVFTTNTYAVEKILRALPSMINFQKDDGFTALHLAALNGLTEIMVILVKQANCNKELKTINGQTALHLAIDKGHNKCIEALVNNGADVNAQDKDGDTSLHLLMMKASMKDLMRATPMGQLLQLVEQVGSMGDSSDERSKLVAIAVYLINNNADIYIKNNKGSTVLDVTINPGIEKLLKELHMRKRAQRLTAASDRGGNCKVS